MSSTSVSISWTPLSSGVNGYIIVYNGGQPVIINGQNTSNYILEGLSKGTTYQISVYSYYDIPSGSANGVSIRFDGNDFEVSKCKISWVSSVHV